MKRIETELSGVEIIEFDKHVDERGNFIKIYNQEMFKDLGLDFEVEETFYSTSKKNVIRGMHFQAPPYDHNKLVHVIKGAVVDVVMDIRKDSPDYLKCIGINLAGEDAKALYIPKGFAHGFLCLEDDTIIIYQVSKGYHPCADTGILYNSISYEWGIDKPIVSERDLSFKSVKEWNSPF